MSSLVSAIAERFTQNGARSAIHFDNEWLSFADLHQRALSRAAALIERGLQPGQHVAVGLPSSIELVEWVVGVLYAGGVLVPLNPAYTMEELSYVVTDAQARFAVLAETQQAALDGSGVVSIPAGAAPSEGGNIVPRAREGRDAALIVYTSGTTGRPKGAVLSHHALLTNFTTVARAWQWTEADRLLLTLPCFHLHGLGLGLLTSFLIGSSVVFRPRFQIDQVLRDLADHRATMFFGVPTIYNRLVSLPAEAIGASDLSAMRLWVSGSAPLNPVIFERFRERFGYPLMDRYGMTECCFALSTAYDEARRPGVVGRALPGVEVRLVEPEAADQGRVVEVATGQTGEILIAGESLFDGYWRQPEATARASLRVGDRRYLRSGDIAVVEPDGQFRIVGRSSVDIIKTRGFKVGAGEIEAVLQRHPAVQEVAVIGIPDPDQGERVVAVITPVAGAIVSAEAVQSFARQHLAPHKVPSRVELMDEIPRTGPGKFKKKDLIAKLS